MTHFPVGIHPDYALAIRNHGTPEQVEALDEYYRRLDLHERDHADHWHGETVLDGHDHTHFHPIGLPNHVPVEPADVHKHEHVHLQADPAFIMA